MGPRLVSRGKEQMLRGLIKTEGKLQWGRDLLVAERQDREARGVSTVCASMGPRLVSRGKDFGLGGWKRIVDASMGPRLVSRGKVIRRH